MESDKVAAVAVNVGSQTGEPLGRGPIFADGSFEYIPITEKCEDEVDWPTYSDLGYDSTIIAGSEEVVTHFDPEFPELPGGEHYTFADPGDTKTRQLEKLSQGDYVFFYGTLDFDDGRRQRYWINNDWGGYLFGHFRLQRDPISIEEYRNLPETERSPFSNNAHLRRPEQDPNLLMLLGDPDESELYDTAVPLSLPEGSLGPGEKRSPFFDSDGIDIQMVWYRGPVQMTKERKDELLEAHQTGDARHLYGAPLSTEPGFEDFDAELSPPSSFSDFCAFIDDHDLSTEQELLAAFSYVSGGWSLEIPKAIVTDTGLGIRNLSELTTSDEVRETLSGVFDDLHDSSGWPHGHRSNLPRNAGRQREEGESYGPYEAEILIESMETFAADVNPSFTDFLDDLDQDTPFLDALRRIKQNVYSFRRLAAFDFLEVTVQALNYDWLAPTQLRYEYVNSSGPRRGLEHVFGLDEISDAELREKTQNLTRLTAYACEDRGMELSEAIFSVESALCNCQKEDRGAADTTGC